MAEEKEVDPVAAAYNTVSGRLSPTLANTPQTSSSIFSGLSNTLEGSALALLQPTNPANLRENPFNRNKVLMGRHYEFGIGKYHIQYRGYRMVREAEWQDPAFQAVLVQAHREGINRKSG